MFRGAVVAIQWLGTLVTLHLTNNRIGDQGAEAIAVALKRNVAKKNVSPNEQNLKYQSIKSKPTSKFV